MHETEINLPYITADAIRPKTFEHQNYHAQNLNHSVHDIFERLLEPCKKALADAKLNN